MKKNYENRKIGSIIRRWLLVVIAVALLALLCGALAVQILYQRMYSYSLTKKYVRDMEIAIADGFDHMFMGYLENVLRVETNIYGDLITEISDETCKETVEKNNIIMSEINIADENGIIVHSSEPEHIGFDFSSEEQTAEFLCLLNGTDIYIQKMKDSPFDENEKMKYGGIALPDGDGFYQIGISEENYHGYWNSMAAELARDRRVGISGAIVICDHELNVLGSTNDFLLDQKLEKPDILPDENEEYEESIQRFSNENCYVVAAVRPDYIIIGALPVSETGSFGMVSIALIVAIIVLIMLCVFFTLSRLLNRQVISGIENVHGSLERIASGDLKEKADVRSSLEFKELSEDINHTVDRLKGLIREVEERNKSDLELAGVIQTSFIPHEFPAFPDREEFELYAKMVPAKEVGGDFYDYFQIDEDHLVLVIADVCGKGVPAAMLMVSAMDKIRSSVRKHGMDVVGALTEVNRDMMKENDAQLFVTVWLGIITLSTGHVDYVDAGHERPIIMEPGGAFAKVHDVHNPYIGMIEFDYQAGSFELQNGSVLYLYTDGMQEAINGEQEMFGTTRMLDALNRDRNTSVENMDTNVRKDIAEFVKDEPQFDDMTSLCFRYKGNGKTEEAPESDWFL